MNAAESDHPTAYRMLYRGDGTQHGYWCARYCGIDRYRPPELLPPFLFTREELAARRKPAAATTPDNR